MEFETLLDIVELHAGVCMYIYMCVGEQKKRRGGNGEGKERRFVVVL
jgi:hypothetical protein